MTNPSALVLTLTAPIAALDAKAGDCVLIRPGHLHPVLLQRDLPDAGAAVIAALNEFEVLSAHAPAVALEMLRALAGVPAAPVLALVPAEPHAHEIGLRRRGSRARAGLIRRSY